MFFFTRSAQDENSKSLYANGLGKEQKIRGVLLVKILIKKGFPDIIKGTANPF